MRRHEFGDSVMPITLKHSAVSNTDALDDASFSTHSDSESFMSTNYTMSNLPGTGRILDMLYRAGGRKIERLLGRLAQRAGYGPDAVGLKIRQLAWSYSSLCPFGINTVQPTKEQRELSNLCRRLLQYSQSSLESTQMRAISNIIDLLRWEPMLYSIFKQHSFSPFIRFVGSDVLRYSSHPGSYSILSATHDTFQSMGTPSQALEWTPTDALMKLGSILLPTHEHKSPQLGCQSLENVGGSRDEILRPDKWSHAFRSMLTYLKLQDSAFLALQYFYWWSYGVERNVTEFDFPLGLELAESLTIVLSYENLFQATDPHYLEITSRRVLSRLSFAFAFLKQNSERNDLDDSVGIHGIIYHIPSVIRVLEELAVLLHTRRLAKHADISVNYSDRRSSNPHRLLNHISTSDEIY